MNMENSQRSKSDINQSVPNIKFKEPSGSSTCLSAQSETPRRIKISSEKQSPIPTPKDTPPQSTRQSKNSTSKRMSAKHVGFKPVELRSQTDLRHNRFITENLPVSKRPEPILQTLNQMLNNIPTERYENSNSSQKLSIINKLMEAYNFAWNEASLQIKELSEEHAIVLTKLKFFYNSLFVDYPKLLNSFNDEVSDLKTTIQERDQRIEALVQQIDENNESFRSAGDFLFGIKKELEEVTARRDFFEAELNTQVLENDSLQSTITDLRCILSKQKEKITRLVKLVEIVSDPNKNQDIQKKLQEHIKSDILREEEEPTNEKSKEKTTEKPEKVQLIDVAVDTADLPLPLNENRLPSTNFSLKGCDFSLMKSEETFLLDSIQEEKIDKSHAPLRRIILNFMQKSSCNPDDVKKDIKLIPDQLTDIKKYYWVYPKLISIFINGLRFENKEEKPFESFDDVVINYFNSMYQTSYLANLMQQSLINSIQVFEKSDSSVRLFHSFLKKDYDIQEFRFMNVLIEYSINATEPPIPSLMSKDMLTPEDTYVVIKKNKARDIYRALFPVSNSSNDEIPTFLRESIIEPYVEFWMFLERCIKRFDECRIHMWAIIKNGLLLVDCSDTSHITYKHFRNFFGVTLPTVSNEEIKLIWSELSTRNKATEKRGDMLDFDAICYFVTRKEDFFFEIIKRSTAKNFTAKYFDMNGSLLNAVAFIVKRLVYYLPSVGKSMKTNRKLFNSTEELIRGCLFMCDICGAFAHYRMLLHLIDGVFVRDYTGLKLSDKSSDNEVNEFLEHFETREKSVGIISLSKSS